MLVEQKVTLKGYMVRLLGFGGGASILPQSAAKLRLEKQIIRSFCHCGVRPRSAITNPTVSSSSMGQRLSASRSRPPRGSMLRAQDRDAIVEREEVGDRPSGLWIVAGLGNPGPKFVGNRHNVGFMAVDAIARREGVVLDKKLSKAAVARCSVGGQKVLLAKPLTYMNLSGESVSSLAKFYKVPTNNIMIIYDDLDTPLASVKLKEKGGHGGHNGIRNLGQHLSGNFPRIKIGIGRPPGSKAVIDYVLQDFSKMEKQEIDCAIQDAITTLDAVFKFGIQRAVSGRR